ncbi:hypothetical protein ACOTI8_31010 [Achromobacter xylosoxidans]|uniref:hypothetical protein n=1 Tax=Alcaligenes xylosoxydans xylosoxydans TaxID=85698 RepID=UPI0005F96AFB|nr:hypothetical protein [Achromobacter xylosoxidans]
MHIKKKISQSRRDFYAIYACGHCGHEEKGCGYDDAFFHNNVIPSMKCAKCGETEQQSSTADVPAHAVL